MATTVIVAAGVTAAMTPAEDLASLSVKLAALITPANSTAQIFASSSYYDVDWSPTYGAAGKPQVVPFFLGPQGIASAIDDNSADPVGVTVLASGWGAGQTSTALAAMQAADDPAQDAVRLVVLDNNTNRAGGGFWTTYSMFAPLLNTSAAPTPTDLSVPVVDVAYEYNINSNAPTYPINLLADLNSLMAYVYDYGGQARAPMPAEALDPVEPGTQHYHYVVAPDGTVDEKIAVDGNITYVTFKADGLPLLRPLRAVPGGDALADAIEPTATAWVNAGYQDKTPIPTDPGKLRTAGLLPPKAGNLVAPQRTSAATGQKSATAKAAGKPAAAATAAAPSASHERKAVPRNKTGKHRAAG